jgi:UDP-N-acetylmuramoylalanine--D-glutamate ligase
VSAPFQSALVVGLGKSGLAAVELLLARGVKVAALDEKPDSAVVASLAARGVTVHGGPLDADRLRAAEVVVVSPGVPLSRPELKGARVIGEVELAYRCLPAGAGPVLGITGTNGKSTTTALLGELVKASGAKTFVGGNLGRPFSEACSEKHDVHVVELSSFQLEGIERFSCRGATILNLTPDHLDRYPSHAAYGLAKARIFQNPQAGGFVVLNGDDADSAALARHAQVPVHWFSLKNRADFLGRYRLANRALRGDHNLSNAMAAVMLAELHGVPKEAIQKGLDTFPGLAHRLEFVRDLHGVEWINDSKATNVDSSLVALNALPGNIWLIAGGKGKGAPYAPLVLASAGKVKGVLTIGDDAPTLEAAFDKSFKVVSCGTLQRAVEEARKRSAAGDVVLLSPACASYDQFKNFEHRGESFKALVLALT